MTPKCASSCRAQSSNEEAEDADIGRLCRDLLLVKFHCGPYPDCVINQFKRLESNKQCPSKIKSPENEYNKRNYDGCDCECGQSVHNYIEMDATSNKFPWVVQIADWRKSLKTLCSGTLINGHYVLTTGSCVASFKNVPLNLIVITGTKKRLANEIILHDRYNPASFENNIALLKFLMPFNVIPACLPSEEISFAGNQSGAVFGWTQKKDLETHGTKSIANRWGELVRSPVLVTKCGDNQVHSTVLCASERDYSDESKICKQTTGGGPLILAKHPRSRFKLIGVSNIGVECGDAAEKIITFADIQKHLAWMKRITKTTCITCLK